MSDKDKPEAQIIQARPAMLTAQVYGATVKIRNRLSSNYLWAAKHLTELAQKIEDEHEGRPKFDIKHRAYVLNAIFSSVTFLEAVVNELFQDAKDNHGDYIKALDRETVKLMAAFWDVTELKNRWVSNLDKYQVALQLAGPKQFEKGKAPYQDVNILVKLRNDLTHYKPQSSGAITPKLMNTLMSKVKPNKLMIGSGEANRFDKLLGADCAAWAIKSSVAFTDEFCERLGIKPPYQQVDFDPTTP